MGCARCRCVYAGRTTSFSCVARGPRARAPGPPRRASSAAACAAHVEAQVERDLVVARARGVQAPRDAAELAREQRLDGHVHVFFVARLSAERAAAAVEELEERVAERLRVVRRRRAPCARASSRAPRCRRGPIREKCRSSVERRRPRTRSSGASPRPWRRCARSRLLGRRSSLREDAPSCRTSFVGRSSRRRLYRVLAVCEATMSRIHRSRSPPRAPASASPTRAASTRAPPSPG